MSLLLPERDTGTLGIIVPSIPAELLERILESAERFQLAVYQRGKERAREPLWIPFWPTKAGQRVQATQASVFRCTDWRWKLDSWSVYGAGEHIFTKISDPFPTLYRGDSVSCGLNAWAEDV